MRLKFFITGSMILSVATGLVISTQFSSALTSEQSSKIDSEVISMQTLPTTIKAIEAPKLADPEWLKQQNAAEAAAAQKNKEPATRVVTYDVSSKGLITANFTEFKTLANASLNDARGWARMGIVFREVSSGGMFTLVLSEAGQVSSFSSGCGVEYSCRVGRNVIINQDRWIGATASWNQAGGSLRDYRHMVVNHETGHWLGHDHESCGGTGQAAPVMQQQSISLQGCRFNPWALDSELWSTTLGIKRS